MTFLQSVTLPNGRSWGFNYNSWGDLTSVSLPTGGTVSYGWQMTPDCYSNINRAIATRTLDANDGTGGKTWTYTPGSLTDTVTDPAGNDAVHTFTSGSTCTPFETKTDYYNGSSGSGQRQKTVEIQYSDINTSNPFMGDDSFDSPYNLVPISTKTTT